MDYGLTMIEDLPVDWFTVDYFGLKEKSMEDEAEALVNYGDFINVKGHRIRKDLIISYWSQVSTKDGNPILIVNYTGCPFGSHGIGFETLDKAESQVKKLDDMFRK